MTNGDREGPIFKPRGAKRWSSGRIFLSHPHTNNVLFFLLTTKYLILYW